MLPHDFLLFGAITKLPDDQIMQGFSRDFGQVHVLNVGITEYVNQLRNQSGLHLT